MGCTDCDEERLARAARAAHFGPTQAFTLPFPDAELTLTTRGALTSQDYAVLKDWLGLVYDQLRPSDEKDRSMTDEERDEYYEYLDALRESGITNMFGAPPYLQKAYPELDERAARDVCAAWMKSDRHRKATA